MKYEHLCRILYITECTEDQFQCPEGSCISSIWLCDGEIDCHLSGADEANCTTGKIIS